MKIGFIGQGFIGKNYADDFENRSFDVIRYALEEPHIKNENEISKCDIVFIAVPTPTTPAGFDDTILKESIKKVGSGKIVVIKSTIVLGTTKKIQKENPNIKVLHSPEFLKEHSAPHDASNPERNIIGVPEDTSEYRKTAEKVMSILPEASYNKICLSDEAELIKYAGNCFLYTKIIFMNLLYDLAKELDVNYETISEAMSADSRIGKSHMEPVHKSGSIAKKGGRGAGGHCFIKDFSSFRSFYEELFPNEKSLDVLKSLEQKNIELLKETQKDLDLLEGVYGKDIL